MSWLILSEKCAKPLSRLFLEALEWPASKDVRLPKGCTSREVIQNMVLERTA